MNWNNYFALVLVMGGVGGWQAVGATPGKLTLQSALVGGDLWWGYWMSED